MAIALRLTAAVEETDRGCTRPDTVAEEASSPVKPSHVRRRHQTIVGGDRVWIHSRLGDERKSWNFPQQVSPQL